MKLLKNVSANRHLYEDLSNPGPGYHIRAGETRELPDDVADYLATSHPNKLVIVGPDGPENPVATGANGPDDRTAATGANNRAVDTRTPTHRHYYRKGKECACGKVKPKK